MSDDAPLLHLHMTKQGDPKINLYNVVEILTVDPAYAGRLSWCAFAVRPLLDGDVVPESFIGELALDLGRRYGLHGNEKLLRWGMVTAARKTTVDPLVDYLLGLEWDQVPRLDHWLVTYLHAEPSKLTAPFGRKWMISAVARALDPGCQVDTVLVIHGGQGAKKTTALRVLAGEAWYLSQVIDVRTKDARQLLTGRWLVEWAELDALRKADANTAKAFITDTHDVYRPPYGAEPVERPRRCVFIGTTNDEQFLGDSTGDRRFWVVSLKPKTSVDVEALRTDRDQLWAEAVHRYLVGREQWWLTEEEEGWRSALSATYRVEDPWAPVIERWIAANRPSGGFTTEEVLHDQGMQDRSGSWTRIPGIGMDLSRSRAPDIARAKACLRQLGWEERRRGRGDRRRAWWRVQ